MQLGTVDQAGLASAGRMPEYQTTRDTSAWSGIPVATLETLRSRGGGPRFIKRGARVLYAVRDVREWIEAGARMSTSDQPSAA